MPISSSLSGSMRVAPAELVSSGGALKNASLSRSQICVRFVLVIKRVKKISKKKKGSQFLKGLCLISMRVPSTGDDS